MLGVRARARARRACRRPASARPRARRAADRTWARSRRAARRSATARSRGCDAVADDVGEIVDVQAREVLRAVRDPEPAERPRQRIVVASPVARDGREPRPLGQEVARRRSAARAPGRGPGGTRPPRRWSRGSARRSARKCAIDAGGSSGSSGRGLVALVALGISAAASRRAASSAAIASRPSRENTRRNSSIAASAWRTSRSRSAACWRRKPVRYAVAGYGVLSWVIGGVRSRMRKRISW